MSIPYLLLWTCAIVGCISAAAAALWAFYRIYLVVLTIKVEIEKKASEYRQSRHEESIREVERKQEQVRGEAEIAELRAAIAGKEADLARIKGADAQLKIKQLGDENEALRTTISGLRQQVQTLTLVGSEDPRVDPAGIAQRVVELLRDNMPVAPSAPVDQDALAVAVVDAVFASGRLDSDTIAHGIITGLAPQFDALNQGMDRVDRHGGDAADRTQAQLGELEQRAVVQGEAVALMKDEMAGLRAEVREIMVSGLHELLHEASSGGSSGSAVGLTTDAEARLVGLLACKFDEALDSFRTALVLSLEGLEGSDVGSSDDGSKRVDGEFGGEAGNASVAFRLSDSFPAAAPSSPGASVVADASLDGGSSLIESPSPDSLVAEPPADDLESSDGLSAIDPPLPPAPGPVWPAGKRSLI